MIKVHTLAYNSKFSIIPLEAVKKIEYDLNRTKFPLCLDGINILFVIGLLDFDYTSIGYSRKNNVVKVLLGIPYKKIEEVNTEGGYEASFTYVYNRLLIALSKIDLTCKRWVTPALRKKV